VALATRHAIPWRWQQDTLLRGAGNKTWSDFAGAGDDNQITAANLQWKARNGRKICKQGNGNDGKRTTLKQTDSQSVTTAMAR
jgi:hypothetical protein